MSDEFTENVKENRNEARWKENIFEYVSQMFQVKATELEGASILFNLPVKITQQNRNYESLAFQMLQKVCSNWNEKGYYPFLNTG